MASTGCLDKKTGVFPGHWILLISWFGFSSHFLERKKLIDTGF
jgi:hypothetical protein